MFVKHFIGWLAAIFMFLSFSYPILKRMKIKGKLLSFHCHFGYIAIILALIHIPEIGFSTGSICLLSMMLIVISGIIMKLKYFRKLFCKNIFLWKWIHIVLSSICGAALIVHIVKYLLLD